MCALLAAPCPPQSASEAAAKAQKELHALEVREAKLSERDAAVAELKASLQERKAALSASERELAERQQQLDRAQAALEAARAAVASDRAAAEAAAAAQKAELERQLAEAAAAQQESQRRLQVAEQHEESLSQVCWFGRGGCSAGLGGEAAAHACQASLVDALRCGEGTLSKYCTHFFSPCHPY